MHSKNSLRAIAHKRARRRHKQRPELGKIFLFNSGGILTSTQKYFETFGHFFEVFDSTEWRDLVGIYDVRNIFIHGGRIDKAKLGSKNNLIRLHDKKVSLLLRDKMPAEAFLKEDVLINSKFCLFSLNTMTTFFKRLEEACVDMDAGLRTAE